MHTTRHIPPEIWELIIRDYNLLSHMKTIKTIPSRHNLNDIMCNLIQPYIDHLCRLLYSINTKIIDKPYIFNTKNLYYIIIYFINDIRPDNLPTIKRINNDISIILNNKCVYINTSLKEIEYFTNHLLHNIDDRPAVIKWCNDEESHLIPYYIGTKQKIAYYYNGHEHRINGPSYIWCASGTRQETYCQYGRKYRKDGPAYIYWHENGNKLKERYYINIWAPPPLYKYVYITCDEYGDKIREHECDVSSYVHRLDGGPAVIEWDMNGNKIKEAYYRCSLYHRTTGPAIIEWYSNGVKKQETYYLGNKIHRNDGPAIIKWDENGSMIEEIYYKDGYKVEIIDN